MRAIETVTTVEIPEGVEGKLEGRIVTIRVKKENWSETFLMRP